MGGLLLRRRVAIGMAPHFGDIGDELISAHVQEEELQGYSVNLALVNRRCPCVVCRQFTAERDPYPGVRLVTYRDAGAAVAYLAWACSDCAGLVGEGRVSAAAIRAAVWEWAS